MEELSDAARMARSAYQRKWRERNKERIREYNRKYWERKAVENQRELEERLGKLEQMAEELQVNEGKD